MKYRIKLANEGFSGAYVVQQRCYLLFWKTIASFSIFSYGNDGAFEKARLTMRTAKWELK